MKFKAASRETVVKRLRKRIELQEESSKRVNMKRGGMLCIKEANMMSLQAC